MSIDEKQNDRFNASQNQTAAHFGLGCVFACMPLPMYTFSPSLVTRSSLRTLTRTLGLDDPNKRPARPSPDVNFTPFELRNQLKVITLRRIKYVPSTLASSNIHLTPSGCNIRLKMRKKKEVEQHLACFNSSWLDLLLRVHLRETYSHLHSSCDETFTNCPLCLLLSLSHNKMQLALLARNPNSFTPLT